MAYFNDKLAPEGAYGAGCIYIQRLALLFYTQRPDCLLSVYRVPCKCQGMFVIGYIREENWRKVFLADMTHMDRFMEKSHSSQREEGDEEEVRHVAGR